jgi:uncharacterized protein YijF (DUF1287 family)
MKFEVSFLEIMDFISNSYNIRVRIKNFAFDKIKVNYIISMVLTVKEVKPDEVIFQYDSNNLYNLLIKGVHFFIKKKLNNVPILWNIESRELVIDLKKIKNLELFLRLSSISELHFKNDALVLVVLMKAK